MRFAGIVRRAWRAASLSLIGGSLIVGLPPFADAAWAQSGVVAGSTLEPQMPNDTLIPLGSFRLDAPVPTPASEDAATPWPSEGNVGFGLQFYGAAGAAPLESAPPLPPAPDTYAPQP